MMNTVKLVPAPLFASTDEAKPLAEAMHRAWLQDDGSDVVSPVLCSDDAEFLEYALNALFEVSINEYSPGGVEGVALVVSFG